MEKRFNDLFGDIEQWDAFEAAEKDLEKFDTEHPEIAFEAKCQELHDRIHRSKRVDRNG